MSLVYLLKSAPGSRKAASSRFGLISMSPSQSPEVSAAIASVIAEPHQGGQAADNRFFHDFTPVELFVQRRRGDARGAPRDMLLG